MTALHKESRPGVGTEATEAFGGAALTLPHRDLYEAATALVLSDAEHLLKRFLLDEIEKAVPFTWLRRAVVFDAVPLPEVAAACRRHAALLFCQLDPTRDLLNECQRLGVTHV